MKIKKAYIQTIEVYQTGFRIKLKEDWISPKSFLNELKEDNPDYDLDNCRLQLRVDKNNEIHLSLYALNIDRVDF